MLAHTTATDFGKELFPQAIQRHRVQTHLFDDYWEDIGTIGAFHRANLDLTTDDPPFDFLAGDRHIFTRGRYLPCSRVADATIRRSLIADGCTIGRGAVIEDSVIGVRAQIGDHVTIRESYIMGSDSYEILKEETASASFRPRIGIGTGSVVERAIIDKNPRIGCNVRIVNQAGTVEAPESDYCVIQDGVVVVPKYTVIPDGTVI
jgi:glucose-1-phosphate adenylyltransferase